jgi:iron complex outermembrane receptor protein
MSLGLSAARAFRAPTVEELFSNGFHHAAGSFDLGDPRLRLETNRGLDAVLRAQSARVSGQLAAYVNRIDDYIAPLTLRDTIDDEGETVPIVAYTQRDASLRGVEGQLEAEVVRHLVLGAMGDLTRGRFREGGALPYMPAARLGGSVRYDNRRLSLGVEARHAFAQGDVSPNEVEAGAYDLLNLSASYTVLSRLAVHTITLRADNVTDERYVDATSRIKAIAPNPGRNLSLVYRVIF